MKKVVLIVVSLFMVGAFAYSQQTQSSDKSAAKDKTSVNTSQSTGTGANAAKKGTAVSSPSVTQPKTGNQPNEHDRGKDLEFANEATSGGLMEVELGKLAQQKASSQMVKDFGRLMERDHTDANNKLKSVLKNLGVPASSTMLKKHQDNVDDLGKKSGKDFDKAYVDLMVKDHKDDVDKFEKAADDLQEPALKQWAASTLTVLKKHLAEAEKLQDQVK